MSAPLLHSLEKCLNIHIPHFCFTLTEKNVVLGCEKQGRREKQRSNQIQLSNNIDLREDFTSDVSLSSGHNHSFILNACLRRTNGYMEKWSSREKVVGKFVPTISTPNSEYYYYPSLGGFTDIIWRRRERDWIFNWPRYSATQLLTSLFALSVLARRYFAA